MQLSRRRRSGSSRVSGALLLIGIAFAVLVMHSVVAHCVSEPSGAHSASAASDTHHGSMPVMTVARETVTPTMTGTMDCGPHQHACVFVRDDLPPLIPLIVVILLVWGFPEPRLLPAWVVGSVRRLGRPPPWAMPTHLSLSVIRC